MSKLFIGIEGVGMRQSVAVAADKTGKIVGAVRLPEPLSLTSMARESLKFNLPELLRTLCHHKGLDRTLNDLSQCTVCIGMTGVTFLYDRDNELRKFLCDEMEINIGKLICTGDPQIIFASHAISNTGSC